MNTRTTNMMYQFDTTIFTEAKTFAEKKEILNDLKFNFNVLKTYNRIPGHKNSARKDSLKLFSRTYTRNIFESSNYEIINEIVDYFTRYNIKVHDIWVRRYQQHLKDVVDTFYRLELICDLINPKLTLNLTAHIKQLYLHVNPQYFENIRYPHVNFYNKVDSKAQRSRPKHLEHFEIVYSPINDEFVGTMRENEDYLKMESLIKTLEIAYFTKLKELEEKLKTKKKQLQVIILVRELKDAVHQTHTDRLINIHAELAKVQPDLLWLNACVDWYQENASHKAYPQRDPSV